MKKIENWSEIEAKGMDDFTPFPAGVYECVIVNACENFNKDSGKTTLKVMVDIASGEYKGYFTEMYDKNTNVDRRWNNNSTKYLSLEEQNLSYLKGFITSVENSNPGYTWDWDETKLRGKKICCVYQWEQYQTQDGKIGVSAKLNKFRSLDKMKDIKEPTQVKMLDGSYVEYEDYMKNNGNSNSSDEIEVTGDMLPF